MLAKSNLNLKIGIFGGTFNPPHVGHVQAAKAAFEQLALDELIIVPSGLPPHKELPDNSPSPQSRFELTSLSFKHMLNTVVSDLEIFEAKPVYTVDTVMKIRADYPNSTVFLLMGTDMYLSIESWKEASRLMQLIIPTVFARNLNDYSDISQFSEYLKKNYGTDTEIVINQAIDISSSEIREALPKRDGLRYIKDICYSYIVKNALYGVRTDLDWLRAKAYSLLKNSRIKHVQYCEEAAQSLAIRWGADPDEAREAAILHDITKNFSKCQHLEIFKHYNIIFDMIDINVVKLLHPETGAIIAKNEFSATEDVVQAIKWHTTGRRGMTIMEKIIYIADYIESTRDFPKLDILRKLAFENLDKAMIMGLELTIEEITSRGLTPNRLSIDALHDLLKGNLNE